MCRWVWFVELRKWCSIVKITAGSRGEAGGSFWSFLTQQGGTTQCFQALLSRLSCCHGDRVAQEEMAIYTQQVQKERHPSNGCIWLASSNNQGVGLHLDPLSLLLLPSPWFTYWCLGNIAMIVNFVAWQTCQQLLNSVQYSWTVLYVLSCWFVSFGPSVSLRMHAWWFLVPTLSHCNYFSVLLFCYIITAAAPS